MGKARETDWVAALFSASLILLVVVGHMTEGSGFSGPFDLLPPYAYQVAGFAFVSGYLYSTWYDAHFGPYVRKRFKKMVIPMFAIYFAYGAMATLLRREFGFTFGTDLTLESWLAGTLLNGAQFQLNYPMWFIAPFVLAQLLFVALRSLFRWIELKMGRSGECARWSGKAACVLCVLIGALSVLEGGPDGLPAGVPCLLTRAGFLCSWVAIGRLYAAVLRKRDTLGNAWYYLVVAVMLLALYYVCDGHISYTPGWSRFPHGIIGTYVATGLCIAALWRACRILEPSARGSRLVLALSSNTFSVMCHHVMGFFVLNCLAWAVSESTGALGLFDAEAWHASVTYAYLPHGIPQFGIARMIFAVCFSLAVHAAWVRIRRACAGLLGRARVVKA